NLQVERVVGASRTVWRALGLAVRVVGGVGRRELRVRWSLAEGRKLGSAMLDMATVSLILSILSIFCCPSVWTGVVFRGPPTSEVGGVLVTALIGLLLIHICPLALAFALRRLQWPVLAMPAALACFVLGARSGISAI